MRAPVRLIGVSPGRVIFFRRRRVAAHRSSRFAGLSNALAHRGTGRTLYCGLPPPLLFFITLASSITDPSADAKVQQTRAVSISATSERQPSSSKVFNSMTVRGRKRKRPHSALCFVFFVSSEHCCVGVCVCACCVYTAQACERGHFRSSCAPARERPASRKRCRRATFKVCWFPAESSLFSPALASSRCFIAAASSSAKRARRIVYDALRSSAEQPGGRSTAFLTQCLSSYFAFVVADLGCVVSGGGGNGRVFSLHPGDGALMFCFDSTTSWSRIVCF